MNKECAKCHKTLELSNFYKTDRNNDGYYSYCKQCHNQVVGKSHGRAVRQKLQKAVRAGLITRPNACDECGKPCKPHGHHYDYSKPLDVIWLCSEHHRMKHRRLKDYYGKSSTLDLAAMRRIRKLNSMGWTKAVLAQHYDVKWITIHRICLGRFNGLSEAEI